jgi:glycolate oxidase FAD binding subunit
VAAASRQLGGEAIAAVQADPFWEGLRDQRDEFFVKARAAVRSGASLWRLSVPPTAAPLRLPGEQLIEWGGAQRWWCTPAPAAAVREAAARAGGHATRWLGPADDPVFTPLPPVLARLHRSLKAAFDPQGLFNRGRLMPGL